MDLTQLIAHKLVMLNKAQKRAEQVRESAHEDRPFDAFLVAMEALYQCFAVLPPEIEQSAREIYDTLNAAFAENQHVIVGYSDESEMEDGND
jgi:hypothetical protein